MYLYHYKVIIGIKLHKYLKKLLKTYVNETGSKKAKKILENFRMELSKFWIVRPKELTKVPLNLEKGE